MIDEGISFGSVFSLGGGVVEFDGKGGLHAVAFADHEVDVLAVDFVAGSLVFVRLPNKEEIAEADFADEGVVVRNERLENVIKTKFSIGEEFVALAVGETRSWGWGRTGFEEVQKDAEAARVFARLCHSARLA